MFTSDLDFPRRARLAVALAVAAAASVPLEAIEATLSARPGDVVRSSPWQWRLEGAETVPGTDGGPSIALSQAAYPADADTELLVHFDGKVPEDAAGRWKLSAPPAYRTAGRDEAALGAGAGRFERTASRLSLAPSRSVLFSPGMASGDFSIEFWLNPARAESGEAVFLLKASLSAEGKIRGQRIECLLERSRFAMVFENFFRDPTGAETNVRLAATSLMVPGSWSHHLVRFDSGTGLLEYLLDGRPEAVAYATSTGRERGTVFAPVAGAAVRLELAPDYTGLMDEFRVVSRFVERPTLRKYESAGGTALSPIYDLGATNSRLLSLGAVSRALSGSALDFAYRIADSSAGWTDELPSWRPALPGADISGVRGRYVQVRVSLYPDGAGRISPRLDALAFRYEPDLPPPPPNRVVATPGDGRVTVSWTPVRESDVRGYMVYYGLASGDYLGEDAAEGPSPVAVPGGRAGSFSLSGLRNGTLYYIAVASYDAAEPPHVGEFSAETAARPARALK